MRPRSKNRHQPQSFQHRHETLANSEPSIKARQRQKNTALHKVFEINGQMNKKQLGWTTGCFLKLSIVFRSPGAQAPTTTGLKIEKLPALQWREVLKSKQDSYKSHREPELPPVVRFTARPRIQNTKIQVP